MIIRFFILIVIIAVVLWGLGRVLASYELRSRAAYPAFLMAAATALTFLILFLEQHL